MQLNLLVNQLLFKVKVKEIKSKELPELNDELAKEIDEEVEGLDAFRTKLKEKTAAEEKKAASETALRDELSRSCCCKC